MTGHKHNDEKSGVAGWKLKGAHSVTRRISAPLHKPRCPKQYSVSSVPKGESHRPCPQKNREVVLLKRVSLGVGVGHLVTSLFSSPTDDRELPPNSISSNSALNSAVRQIA